MDKNKWHKFSETNVDCINCQKLYVKGVSATNDFLHRWNENLKQFQYRGPMNGLEWAKEYASKRILRDDC